jgi:hypothetical protein
MITDGLDYVSLFIHPFYLYRIPYSPYVKGYGAIDDQVLAHLNSLELYLLTSKKHTI